MHDDDTPRCVCCGRERRHHEWDRWTCRPCETRLSERLAWIERAYHQLASHLEPGSRGDSGRVSGSRSAPLPVVEQVASLRGPGDDAIVGKLLVHEDAWRAELTRTGRRYPGTPWRGNLEQTLAGTVAFLRGNLLWACESYEHLDDLAGDLAKLYGAAKAIIEGQPEKGVHVICPCDMLLWVTLSTDGRRCAGCDTSYSWGELRRLPLAERSAAA